MDTSETYIKMCEQAEEIQRFWQPDFHDFWVYKDMSSQELSEGFTESPVDMTFDKTWLPRQDQLQEMLKEPTDVLLTYFYDFCGSDYLHTGSDFFRETVRRFTSMEQLWLVFAMKEKYQKVWDGEKWIT